MSYFCETVVMLLCGTIRSQSFCQRPLSKWAHLAVEVFVLSGLHALRPTPYNLSWGLASGRWRWPGCTGARCIFSFWENFARLPRRTMLAFLLPEIVIEVAYMTAEAILLSGIVSSKYFRERQVVAK